MLFLLFLIIPIHSTVIGENAILDRPVINCTESAIVATIATMTPFRGSIFVRGHHDDAACRQIYYLNDLPEATFIVSHGTCGVRRLRAHNGVYQEVTLVITLHHQFVTRGDRTVNVKCFYQQADKVVHANMEIGAMPTETIERSTTILPSCQYSIREGSVDGPPVKSTLLGATLFHRWECDNPRYGMLVKNCYITDGTGQSIQIVDERGCTVPDTVALGQVFYQTPNLAYVAFDAFNFPDRDRWQAECQITVCSKRDSDCLGLTPPNCPLRARSDFRPNSIMEPNAIPTQVVASFEGLLKENMVGDPVIEGTIIPASMSDNRIQLAPVDVHPWRREQNSIEGVEEEEDHSSDYRRSQENETEEVTTTANWEIPTIPDHLLFARDAPMEIFVKSSTPASALRGESLRERRLADQVVEVESEPIEVRALDDPRVAELRATMIKEEPPQQLTCLNNVAVYTMGGAFGVTCVLSLVFIIYLWRDLYKSCLPSPDLEHFASASTASCQSSEFGSEHPIYTRRLGQNGYVIPVRLQ